MGVIGYEIKRKIMKEVKEVLRKEREWSFWGWELVKEYLWFESGNLWGEEGMSKKLEWCGGGRRKERLIKIMFINVMMKFIVLWL